MILAIYTDRTAFSSSIVFPYVCLTYNELYFRRRDFGGRIKLHRLGPVADQTLMVKNQPATTVLSKCRSRSGSVKRCLLAAAIACHLASHADDDVDAVRTEGKETRRATEQRYEARVVERSGQDSFTRLYCVCVCFLPIHSGHQVVLLSVELRF